MIERKFSFFACESDDISTELEEEEEFNPVLISSQDAFHTFLHFLPDKRIRRSFCVRERENNTKKFSSHIDFQFLALSLQTLLRIV